MLLAKKNNSFGNRVKELRLRAGLTQAQLADKLNISSSTVGMYEQGRREPDNNTLTKICSELRVSVDYLLGTSENYTKSSHSEVDTLILDFIDFIESKKDLTFDGNPISKEKKDQIISALKVAAAVIIVESCKDSNQSYRELLLSL